MSEAIKQNQAEVTFEDAYRRLEEISRRLEDSATPLELSFQLYEEGQALVVRCQKLLDDAERRFKLIKAGPNGIETEETTIA